MKMLILDETIHDTRMEIGRLQDRLRMLGGCESDLKHYGLEGMSHYEMTDEFEYMHDKDNKYFDIFKNSYSKGWKR